MAKIKRIQLPNSDTVYDIGADWSNISNKPDIITQQQVDDAIDAKLAANDAMLFKGTLGTDGTVSSLPAYGYQAGWTYKVATVGMYAGELCEVGDMLVAIKDGPSSGSSVINADWAKLQNNVDVFDGATSSAAGSRGLVPAPASGDQDKYLKGDGTWATISTTIPLANVTNADDLKAIEALSGTSGLLKKTGTNTWTLDTTTYTTNLGTITGITMNGSSKGTSGVVNLGTVLTAHQDISGKENTTNKITSITSSSTDTQYPSAKAVYTLFNSIRNVNGVSY